MMSTENMVIFSVVIIVVIIAVIMFKKEHFVEKIGNRKLGDDKHIRMFALVCKPNIMNLLRSTGFEGGIDLYSVLAYMTRDKVGKIIFRGIVPMDSFESLGVSDKFNCVLNTVSPDGSRSENIGFADAYYSTDIQRFYEAFVDNPRIRKFIDNL